MPDRLNLYRGADGVALARSAVDHLAERTIPTSPANYEVWTAYLIGAYPDLNHEIDARLARGGSFTDEVNEDLYERFFAQNRLSVRMVEASAGIARELADVVASLRNAGALAGDFAGELQAAASDMERSPDPTAFCSIVGRLASATREMAENNLKLEQQMQASSRQVEVLQTTLQNVRTEALTDGLTGLANRRCFDETLRSCVTDADKHGGELCLVLCDIDHFKRVNDTWGHQVGDQVLRYVASVLRQHASEQNLVSRYGGEEFAIVLPGYGLGAAEALAESIRTAVKAKKLSRRSTGEMMGSVTVSLGVASYRASEGTSGLLRRADACLYQSKRTGRDRCTGDTVLETSTAA